MKALRTLLLIPLLPVLIGAVLTDIVSESALSVCPMRLTNRILDAVLG